ncbi:MAG: LD-carboxypeptidase [Treponema sp.]|nr:LD-carboxypeptidase [Treponema sp.]
MDIEKLQPGDQIGIISPCYIVKKGQYDEAVKGLKSLGYKPVLGRNIYKDTYGYSASEQERADDFNVMIADPEIKMILFGGGFAGNEILPYIDFENIKRNKKFILSYSDGTNILNSITSHTGLKTYYGQRPSTFVNITEYNKKTFINNFVNENCIEFLNNSDWKIIFPVLMTRNICFFWKILSNSIH